MSTLFISHSSQDRAQAEELNALLDEKGYGWKFLDFDPEQGIQAGASWERTLYTKLRSCRAVVALCTDNYLDSKWCFAEVALARMEGKKIFALQLDPWSKKTKMPSILTADQFIDLRQKREEGLERLWLAFEAAGIVPEQHRRWKPDDPPYPGLRAFDESDEAIFFGREKEVGEGVELLSRVRRQGHPRLAMVLGASGSGKSSLARAGILPRLRRDADTWRLVGPFRPGRDPATELSAALSAAFAAAGKPVDWEEIRRSLEQSYGPSDGSEAAPAAGRVSAQSRLLEALRSMETELSGADATVAESLRQLQDLLLETQEAPPAGAGADSESSPRPEPQRPSAAVSPLGDWANRLRLAQGPSEATVVVVIDQFEELLGHDDKGPEHPANRFLSLLRDALEADDSPILGLATMRSDYLGSFQRCGALVGVGFASLSVGPMAKEAMREVIEQPAKLGGLQLEPGLTDLLLDDTGSSDALPLLAFTLREMWNRYRDDLLLGIDEYRALGGLQGAIAQVADETLEVALRLGSKEDLRDAFLSLARPTAEGSGWARQPASWDDLASRVAEARPMLQHFVDQRLLVQREGGTVEVAHEALFRSWDTLARWLDANAEGLRLLSEIHTEAKKWDRESDPKEKELYLFRGGRLARALELRDGGVLKLKDLDKGFVEASEAAQRAQIEAEEARRRRELRLARTIAAVVGVAFLAAAALGLWAWTERQKAEKARQVAAAGRLASLAENRVATDLELALLLSVEGYQTRKTPETVRALSTTLHHSPRLLRFLHGHGKHAVDAAFSPSGTLLASSSYDQKVRIWNAASGRLLQTLEGHESDVNGIAFSPDGTILASTSDDKEIRLWVVATGALLRPPLAGHTDSVNGVSFSPDGKTLASASEDQTIGLWSLDSREASAPTDFLRNGHTGEIRSVAFSPDGGLLASAGDDGRVVLWDVATGGSRLLWSHGRHDAREVVFSPDGALLASAGRDGVVRLWDRAEPLPPRQLEHEDGVEGVAFSPDGRLLASAQSDGKVLVWQVESVGSPRIAATLEGHADKTYRVEFSPDGSILASASRDRTVALWGVTDLSAPSPGAGEAAVTVYPRPLQAVLRGHTSGVARVAFNPVDANLIASASHDKTIRLWDVEQRRPIGEPLSWHSDSVVDVAFSPDGKMLASAGNDGMALVWDVESRQPRTAPLEHGQAVESVAFSWPDGSMLASASRDHTVRLWDVESGRPIGEPLKGHGDEGVTSVAFQPGGRLLASGSNQACCANQILRDDDRTLRLWDVAERAPSGGALLGETVDTSHTEGVTRVVFSPVDPNLLVTSGMDHKVLVWDVDKRSSRLLATHLEGSYDVAFSRDGSRLASAGYDGTIRLWDFATGGSLGEPLRGHEEIVEGLAFSRDGLLASASYDGTIRVWNVDDSAWPETACQVANRNFSLDEWEQLAGEGVPYRCTCSGLPAGVGAPSDAPRCAAK